LLNLRAVLFWLGFGITSTIAMLILAAFFFLPVRIKFRIVGYWARISLFWLAVTCNLKYRVEGLENVGNGSMIVMGNHQSTWETIACNLFFPPAVWVMKKQVLSIPVLGWSARALQPIAIDRGAGRKAVEQLKTFGKSRLNHGYFVILFPEGTRVEPGKLVRYKIGGAALAEYAESPILPFAHNAGKFWKRKQFTKLPGEVVVKIGKPIETSGLKTDEIIKKVEDWIRNAQQEIEAGIK